MVGFSPLWEVGELPGWAMSELKFDQRLGMSHMGRSCKRDMWLVGTVARGHRTWPEAGEGPWVQQLVTSHGEAAMHPVCLSVLTPTAMSWLPQGCTALATTPGTQFSTLFPGSGTQPCLLPRITPVVSNMQT